MTQRRWVRLFDEPVFFWALGVSTLLSFLVGAEAMKSMFFVSPPNPVLISHITPLICAFAVTHCGVLRTNLWVPDRPEYRMHRLVRYTGFTVLTVLGCALLWVWQRDTENTLTVFRNTLLLVGFSGLLQEIRPVLVWLVPLSLLGVCLLLGVDQAGEIRWWALVLQPANHWPAMLISAVIWAANLVSVTFRPRYDG